ncbi:MAG: hypothetical protein K0R48_1140 [Gammaproteobacteria bacterium]|jgi:hypothetical protein|nr:hypothetical protein [Gammaproteobacteria bacterium]
MAATDSSLNKNIDSSDIDLFCQKFDIKALRRTIGDYRRPNEGTPSNIKPHLALMEKGWIISTGTQRCFFDLLLSPEDKCEGLITVDIDPRVKAYNSFLVLLLYFSESLEEFHHLWKIELQALVHLLREKIKTSEILPRFQLYLNENLETFAQFYFYPEKDSIEQHFPEEGDNTGIEYHKDEALFQKLRRYAINFKIIPLVGNIEDLSFAKHRTITIIDVSNIADYSALHFHGAENSSPRIISTSIYYGLANTQYYSGLYEQQPSTQTIETMQRYFKLFRSYEEKYRNAFSDLNKFFRTITEPEYSYISNISEFDHLPYNFYSEKNLTYLRKAFSRLIEGYQASNPLDTDWGELLTTGKEEKPTSSNSPTFDYEVFQYLFTSEADEWIKQPEKINFTLSDNKLSLFSHFKEQQPVKQVPSRMPYPLGSR